MILEIILKLGLAFVLVLAGAYILFAGRRVLWATLGILALWATANILAVLVAGVSNGRELLAIQDWTLVGIALAAGLLGMLFGRFLPGLAMSLIGFIAGADVALWLYDIAAYMITDLANLSEQTALIAGVVLILIGGLLGLWFIRKTRDEGLILISMIIGVELIQDALRLDPSSSWTAIAILSLALAGVLVQYTDYMRGIKASNMSDGSPVPESSMAYFQDLDLST